MSVAGLSNADRVHKKWVHERNDSGELDVFEAARYFSGAGENLPGYNNQKKMMMMREDRQGWRSGGRMSLDVPMRSSTIPSSTQTHHHHHHNHHHGIEKEKKYKQPNSPGGRLASFLNSLFKQTSSKKKKSKSGSTQSIKDEDDSPGWRRRRRSSISHFHTHSNTNSNSISNSIFSSSSSSITSGFRTPPPYPYPYPYPYAHTPTKSTYKDFRCYSDHHCKQLPLSSFSNNNNNVNATHVKSSTTTTATLQNGADKRSISDYAWLDDKLKFGNGLSQKFRMSTDKYPSEDKELIKKEFSEVDEGADSDSSSDLFELQNYDLGYYSSGLPVYETAHLDSIKRGPPFCNAPV